MALNFFDLPASSSSASARMTGFRAGKCIVDGTCVSPDPRKGRLQIGDGGDGLVHVQWLARDSGDRRQLPEEDLIVINDAYLEKIPQCTDGRVYCLRFTSSDKKLLFWMQEPDASRDEALISEFNRRAGGTPPATSSAAAAAGPSRRTAATVDPEEPPTQSSTDDNLQQLRRLLADFSETLRRARGTAPASSAGVSLGDVLNPQVLSRIGEDPVAVSELLQLMPESCRSPEEVRDTLRSPQLAAAMRGLTQALYTDPAALLSTIGISTPSNSLSGTDPVTAFAQALENSFRTPDVPSSATATEPSNKPAAEPSNKPTAERSDDGSGVSGAGDVKPQALSPPSSSSDRPEKQAEAKKDTNSS